MYTLSRASNLLSLLSFGGLKDVVSNLYSKLQGIINRDTRGTRLHDLLLNPLRSASPNHKTRKSKPGTLEPSLLETLATLLNNSQDKVTYSPAHNAAISDQGDPSTSLLHNAINIVPELKYGGNTYRPVYKSPGDGNVMVQNGPSDKLGTSAFPASLELIFEHERVVGGQIEKEVFCLVRPLKAIPDALKAQDPYRRFEIGGSLWLTEVEGDPGRQMIHPTALLCHFARTTFQAEDTPLGLPTFHVLPLDRVRGLFLPIIHTTPRLTIINPAQDPTGGGSTIRTRQSRQL